MGCGEWFRGFVVFEEILSKKCERNLEVILILIFVKVGGVFRFLLIE